MHNFPSQLPDEHDEPQLLRWLDINQQPLFGLYKFADGHEIRPLEEMLPSLKLLGTAETVPQTGQRIYAGYDGLVASQYTVSVGIWAGDRLSQRELSGQVMLAAIRTRYAVSGNLTLPVIMSGVEKSWRGSAALGSMVKATFEAASAYWLRPPKSPQIVAVGSAVPLSNGGQMPAPLRLSLTAGGSAVLNPVVQTDAGITTWLGTVPAGQTLTIDATPGTWSVTLNGNDVRTALRGPQPRLAPGLQTITITAPGASAVVSWREGVI
ncbi:hypothetical protein [Deinococcus alpinitundrae]|uniref:hypothetical protein n=1 Tax=Deinococcus alpinitundrae TaxID=468913 RepID=UPI00137A00CE|nr:hypothetical protein [Deinococcus alpinitundrae]